MSVSALLSEIYDRGLRDGEKKLSPRERELFLIWDFILEVELGGLSGYLYNRVAKKGRLEAAARAFAKYEVKPLARIAGELARRFRTWRDDDSSETWEEAHARHISAARLELLDEQITKAMEKGYGLDKSKLAKLGAAPKKKKKKAPARKAKRK